MTYVYDFSEGNKDQKDLLGGKGANLAEMTNLGLPVPPGLHDQHRRVPGLPRRRGQPDDLADEMGEHLARLEEKMGRRLGDPEDPLLVSVRSGAKFSMPGMMETVLNVGLNDRSVQGLAASAGGDERFAFDSYRRLLQMFGATVLDIEAGDFHDALDGLKADRGVKNDLDLAVDDLRGPGRDLQGADPSSTPGATSRRSRASSSTWPCAPSSTPGTPTARCSTAARSGSPRTWAPRSTSARWCSATAATTRAPAWPSPATRLRGQGVYGDYLQNAQGEDVVAGIRNTVPLADLERIDKGAYDELLAIMQTLEEHYQRPVRHRVHRRARQALDAADPGRQAHRRRRRSGSPASSSTRA